MAKKRKPPTKADLARKLIERHPDAPSKTLARRLYEENKQAFTNLDAARCAIRYARGNMGNRSRARAADKTQFRPNKQAGWAPECPASIAEPWEPFELPQPLRLLILSDAHIPYHSELALNSAVKFALDEHNPNGLLLNGDWADFYSISRWDKDPNKRDFVGELGRVRECLHWLKACFPRTKRWYKFGNHEKRWNDYVWNKAPELWGLDSCRLEAILDLEKFGFTPIDDKQLVLAGNLPILHGHELQRGISAPVNPARGAWMRTKHTVLVGHSHTTSGHSEPNMFHSETTTWSTGCLCDLRPDYAKFNKWNHGFAYVDIDRDGEFQVHNYKIGKRGKVRLA